MKITINKPTEFEAVYLEVDAGVRYWNDGYIKVWRIPIVKKRTEAPKYLVPNIWENNTWCCVVITGVGNH